MNVQEIFSEKLHFYRLLLTTKYGSFTFCSESWAGGHIGNFKLSHGSPQDPEYIFYSDYNKGHLNSIHSKLYFLSWNLHAESLIDEENEHFRVELTYTSPVISYAKRKIIFEHTPKGGILLEVVDRSIFRSEKTFFVGENYVDQIKGLNYQKIDDDKLPIGAYKLKTRYKKNRLQLNTKYDE